MGEAGLVVGDIALPWLETERTLPQPFTEATLLRRAADSNAGILLFAYPQLDAKSFCAISAVSRIISAHEPFFLKHHTEHGRIEIPGWNRGQYEVLSDEGALLVLLMNTTDKEKRYRILLDGKEARKGTLKAQGGTGFALP